jgi:hypothetical protein
MIDYKDLIARCRQLLFGIGDEVADAIVSLRAELTAALEDASELRADLVQAKQAADCWFEDAKNLAEFKVTVATGINMTLERYRELVEVMEDRDRITGYLRERNQECVDLKIERDALAAQLARAREWMQHHAGCPMNDLPPAYCTCGLTAFLKELDHEN